MIVTRLMGGLGNQMFQYAAGRRLANTHKTTLSMDLSWFDNTNQVDTPRFYELDCFNVAEDFIDPADYLLIENTSGIKQKIRAYTKDLNKPKLKLYAEKFYQFDKTVLDLPDNTVLEGYWQTEKYFADIRDVLLKDFGFNNQPSSKNKQLLDKIKKTESVSIHVRRGDYVTNKNANAFHGTKEQAYYDAALEPILKHANLPSLFVFSDEPEWCKKNLKFDMPTTYVIGNKKGSEDMRLMMHCKHNVIANSSFSWWASWLNQNPKKIVVAPKKWFNDSSINTKDVIPESWIKI